MPNSVSACLLCGEPLRYFHEDRDLECSLCHRMFPGNATCEKGHYVCDECHGAKGLETIASICRQSDEKNPIALAQRIMAEPFIYMHGPEHHVLVGAALLTAYRNCGGTVDWPWALEEMERRGRKVPGGSCGFWGCCGAAVSAGMFISIVTEATPLGGENWGLANRTTALALERIGALGGPRCCKRDSFIAILAAAEMAQTQLGVSMEGAEPVQCTFSARNAQCIGKRCPYHRAHAPLNQAAGGAL